MILYEDPAIMWVSLAAAAVLGAVFGSFINCAAWRTAHGESFLTGRSRCALCGHLLGPADLVPVISYLALGGRCRYCGEKISPRYMLTELAMAAAFVLCLLRFDLSGQALRGMGFAVILLGLSLVDLEIFEIPDGFLIAGIIWWVLTVPLCAVVGQGIAAQLKSALPGAFAISCGMLALSLIFDKVTGKESLGGGDIKLFFMTGLYLGPAGGLLQLICACLTGLLFSAAVKKERIPFGPAISLAAFLALIAGGPVISWYMGLFL